MRPCRRGTPGDADATRDTDLLDTCWQDAAAGQFGESATTRSCGWVNATASGEIFSSTARYRASGVYLQVAFGLSGLLRMAVSAMRPLLFVRLPPDSCRDRLGRRVAA